MRASYDGEGIDQLRKCIDLIRNSPEDRRIVMTAWNPSDIDKMALPPCHMFCQFYVANGELSCQVFYGLFGLKLNEIFRCTKEALIWGSVSPSILLHMHY